jgi:5-epimerase
MHARPLAVEGAFEFAPEVFRDDRGCFVTTFGEPDFVAATGRPLFPVAQASTSTSRRDVVRGIHYTRTPPGVAKYVHCTHGRALDIIVDLRVGSPTYTRWDAVELDAERYHAVYFPVGVGHLFIARTDDTMMSYLLSAFYNPDNELALSPLDPDLDLPIPPDTTPILSTRDTEAPTLAEAATAGLLPDYRQSLRLEEALANS